MLVVFYRRVITSQWPLYENLTSSTKPEVHKVSQFATPSEEDRATATGNMHKNLLKSGVRFTSYASGQTDIHTDRQTNKHTNTQTYSLQSFIPSWGK